MQMRKAGRRIHVTGRASALHRLIQDGTVAFNEDRLPESPLSAVFDRLKRPLGICGSGRSCSLEGVVMHPSWWTRPSGRGGLGLVMASRNLQASWSEEAEARKAVAGQGHRGPPAGTSSASSTLAGHHGPLRPQRYGTSSLVDLMAARRMMPTANFRRTYFEGYRSFSGPVIRERLRPRHYACHGCPIACKQKSDGEIPEYETLSHFGALNENDDLESIIECNRICNENGMDTISAASTIACMAEIRGVRYTGHDLADKVSSILGDDAEAELLRLGSARLAAELGAPETSMSVKGLELPAYDRGAYGMALAYGTSTREGAICEAIPSPTKDPPQARGHRPVLVCGRGPHHQKLAEDLGAVVDSIGACKFAFLAASLEEYARGFAAVTGLPLSAQDLLHRGDAIYALERRINTLRGFTRKDDMLPERFYREPGTAGPGIETPPIDMAVYEDVLDRYYRIRGCDPDGIVTDERAKGPKTCAGR